ncbi:TauD/TfdA family dioxygenase [Pseudomonas aeruginosa]|uniref:TauD/TfdA family dioxygenase n=1 Tax=Pseudomonas aeruginosa TaxID=287 RepID=UPI003D271991
MRTAGRGRRQLHQPLRVPLRRHRPEQRGELLASLRRCLYHPQAHYAHRWRSDDLVIADNLTLLHGREAFAHRAPRHLRRVHIHAEPALRNPHLQRD